MEWQLVAMAAVKLGIAVAVGLVLHALVFRILTIVGRRLDERIWSAVRRPSRASIVLLVVLWALPAVPEIAPAAKALLRHAVGVGVIGAITWLAATLVEAGASIVVNRHDITRADNLVARRMYTQVMFLKRTIIGVIALLGVAVALMTFPRIREIGATLLVSAGFAGLAIGLAARPVLENIIAGLQLVFTQPIRLDDVVVVEGEWGRVEEITATYVVVRIWDERRLIVPFSHFISQPFQNWTRRTADILGTVFVHTDYRVPVQAVRDELTRLCAASELWDGRVCNLQVTDAGERALQLRALVSAADSSRAWDLCVYVREHLIGFLQSEHSDCLPRGRVELANEQMSARPGQDGIASVDA